MIPLSINIRQEVDIGLAPDIGSLAFLPKITGNHSLVRELTYTARPFSAIEAEKLGLLSKVVEGGRDEVIKEALELARLIASKSPVAVASSKHLISHSRDHSVAENLLYTSVWNSVSLMTKVKLLCFSRFACSIYICRTSQKQFLAMQSRNLRRWKLRPSYPNFEILDTSWIMSKFGLFSTPYSVHHFESSLFSRNVTTVELPWKKATNTIVFTH